VKTLQPAIVMTGISMILCTGWGPYALNALPVILSGPVSLLAGEAMLDTTLFAWLTGVLSLVVAAALSARVTRPGVRHVLVGIWPVAGFFSLLALQIQGLAT
jgi:hypothetical protein